MHVNRSLLQVHHFRRQVLSAAVVKRHRAILAHRHEQRSTGAVAQFLERFVKLSEFIGEAGFLNVEDSHTSGGKTAAEDRKCGVSGNRDRLIDWRRKLY